MAIYETSDDFFDGMFLLQERLEKKDRKGNKIYKRRGTDFVKCDFVYWPKSFIYYGKWSGWSKDSGVRVSWIQKETFLLSEEPRRVSNSKPKNKR